MEEDSKVLNSNNSIDRGESFEVEKHQRVKISRLLRGKEKPKDVYDAFLTSFKTTFHASVTDNDDSDSVDSFAAGYVRSDGGVDEQLQNSEHAQYVQASPGPSSDDSTNADGEQKQYGSENQIRTMSPEGVTGWSPGSRYGGSSQMNGEDFQEMTFNEQGENITEHSGAKEDENAKANDSAHQTQISAEENVDITVTQSEMGGDFKQDSDQRGLYKAGSHHSSFGIRNLGKERSVERGESFDASQHDTVNRSQLTGSEKHAEYVDELQVTFTGKLSEDAESSDPEKDSHSFTQNAAEISSIQPPASEVAIERSTSFEYRTYGQNEVPLKSLCARSSQSDLDLFEFTTVQEKDDDSEIQQGRPVSPVTKDVNSPDLLSLDDFDADYETATTSTRLSSASSIERGQSFEMSSPRRLRPQPRHGFFVGAGGFQTTFHELSSQYSEECSEELNEKNSDVMNKAESPGEYANASSAFSKQETWSDSENKQFEEGVRVEQTLSSQSSSHAALTEKETSDLLSDTPPENEEPTVAPSPPKHGGFSGASIERGESFEVPAPTKLRRQQRHGFFAGPGGFQTSFHTSTDVDTTDPADTGTHEDSHADLEAEESARDTDSSNMGLEGETSLPVESEKMYLEETNKHITRNVYFASEATGEGANTLTADLDAYKVQDAVESSTETSVSEEYTATVTSRQEETSFDRSRSEFVCTAARNYEGLSATPNSPKRAASIERGESFEVSTPQKLRRQHRHEGFFVGAGGFQTSLQVSTNEENLSGFHENDASVQPNLDTGGPNSPTWLQKVVRTAKETYSSLEKKLKRKSRKKRTVSGSYSFTDGDEMGDGNRSGEENDVTDQSDDTVEDEDEEMESDSQHSTDEEVDIQQTAAGDDAAVQETLVETEHGNFESETKPGNFVSYATFSIPDRKTTLSRSQSEDWWRKRDENTGTEKLRRFSSGQKSTYEHFGSISHTYGELRMDVNPRDDKPANPFLAEYQVDLTNSAEHAQSYNTEVFIARETRPLVRKNTNPFIDDESYSKSQELSETVRPLKRGNTNPFLDSDGENADDWQRDEISGEKDSPASDNVFSGEKPDSHGKEDMQTSYTAKSELYWERHTSRDMTHDADTAYLTEHFPAKSSTLETKRSLFRSKGHAEEAEATSNEFSERSTEEVRQSTEDVRQSTEDVRQNAEEVRQSTEEVRQSTEISYKTLYSEDSSCVGAQSQLRPSPGNPFPSDGTWAELSPDADVTHSPGASYMSFGYPVDESPISEKPPPFHRENLPADSDDDDADENCETSMDIGNARESASISKDDSFDDDAKDEEQGDDSLSATGSPVDSSETSALDDYGQASTVDSYDAASLASDVPFESHTIQYSQVSDVMSGHGFDPFHQHPESESFRPPADRLQGEVARGTTSDGDKSDEEDAEIEQESHVRIELEPVVMSRTSATRYVPYSARPLPASRRTPSWGSRSSISSECKGEGRGPRHSTENQEQLASPSETDTSTHEFADKEFTASFTTQRTESVACESNASLRLKREKGETTSTGDENEASSGDEEGKSGTRDIQNDDDNIQNDSDNSTSDRPAGFDNEDLVFNASSIEMSQHQTLAEDSTFQTTSSLPWSSAEVSPVLEQRDFGAKRSRAQLAFFRPFPKPRTRTSIRSKHSPESIDETPEDEINYGLSHSPSDAQHADQTIDQLRSETSTRIFAAKVGTELRDTSTWHKFQRDGQEGQAGDEAFPTPARRHSDGSFTSTKTITTGNQRPTQLIIGRKGMSLTKHLSLSQPSSVDDEAYQIMQTLSQLTKMACSMDDPKASADDRADVSSTEYIEQEGDHLKSFTSRIVSFSRENSTESVSNSGEDLFDAPFPPSEYSTGSREDSPTQSGTVESSEPATQSTLSQQLQSETTENCWSSHFEENKDIAKNGNRNASATEAAMVTPKTLESETKEVEWNSQPEENQDALQHFDSEHYTLTETTKQSTAIADESNEPLNGPVPNEFESEYAEETRQTWNECSDAPLQGFDASTTTTEGNPDVLQDQGGVEIPNDDSSAPYIRQQSWVEKMVAAAQDAYDALGEKIKRRRKRKGRDRENGMEADLADEHAPSGRHYDSDDYTDEESDEEKSNNKTKKEGESLDADSRTHCQLGDYFTTEMEATNMKSEPENPENKMEETAENINEFGDLQPTDKFSNEVGKIPENHTDVGDKITDDFDEDFVNETANMNTTPENHGEVADKIPSDQTPDDYETQPQLSEELTHEGGAMDAEPELHDQIGKFSEPELRDRFSEISSPSSILANHTSEKSQDAITVSSADLMFSPAEQTHADKVSLARDTNQEEVVETDFQNKIHSSTFAQNFGRFETAFDSDEKADEMSFDTASQVLSSETGRQTAEIETEEITPDKEADEGGNANNATGVKASFEEGQYEQFPAVPPNSPEHDNVSLDNVKAKAERIQEGDDDVFANSTHNLKDSSEDEESSRSSESSSSSSSSSRPPSRSSDNIDDTWPLTSQPQIEHGLIFENSSTVVEEGYDGFVPRKDDTIRSRIFLRKARIQSDSHSNSEADDENEGNTASYKRFGHGRGRVSKGLPLKKDFLGDYEADDDETCSEKATPVTDAKPLPGQEAELTEDLLGLGENIQTTEYKVTSYGGEGRLGYGSEETHTATQSTVCDTQADFFSQSQTEHGTTDHDPDAQQFHSFARGIVLSVLASAEKTARLQDEKEAEIQPQTANAEQTSVSDLVPPLASDRVFQYSASERASEVLTESEPAAVLQREPTGEDAATVATGEIYILQEPDLVAEVIVAQQNKKTVAERSSEALIDEIPLEETSRLHESELSVGAQAFRATLHTVSTTDMSSIDELQESFGISDIDDLSIFTESDKKDWTQPQAGELLMSFDDDETPQGNIAGEVQRQQETLERDANGVLGAVDSETVTDVSEFYPETQETLDETYSQQLSTKGEAREVTSPSEPRVTSVMSHSHKLSNESSGSSVEAGISFSFSRSVESLALVDFESEAAAEIERAMQRGFSSSVDEGDSRSPWQTSYARQFSAELHVFSDDASSTAPESPKHDDAVTGEDKPPAKSNLETEASERQRPDSPSWVDKAFAKTREAYSSVEKRLRRKSKKKARPAGELCEQAEADDMDVDSGQESQSSDDEGENFYSGEEPSEAGKADVRKQLIVTFAEDLTSTTEGDGAVCIEDRLSEDSSSPSTARRHLQRAAAVTSESDSLPVVSVRHDSDVDDSHIPEEIVPERDENSVVFEDSTEPVDQSETNQRPRTARLSTDGAVDVSMEDADQAATKESEASSAWLLVSGKCKPSHHLSTASIEALAQSDRSADGSWSSDSVVGDDDYQQMSSMDGIDDHVENEEEKISAESEFTQRYLSTDENATLTQPETYGKQTHSDSKTFERRELTDYSKDTTSVCLQPGHKTPMTEQDDGYSNATEIEDSEVPEAEDQSWMGRTSADHAIAESENEDRELTEGADDVFDEVETTDYFLEVQNPLAFRQFSSEDSHRLFAGSTETKYKAVKSHSGDDATLFSDSAWEENQTELSTAASTSKITFAIGDDTEISEKVQSANADDSCEMLQEQGWVAQEESSVGSNAEASSDMQQEQNAVAQMEGAESHEAVLEGEDRTHVLAASEGNEAQPTNNDSNSPSWMEKAMTAAKGAYASLEERLKRRKKRKGRQTDEEVGQAEGDAADANDDDDDDYEGTDEESDEATSEDETKDTEIDSAVRDGSWQTVPERPADDDEQTSLGARVDNYPQSPGTRGDGSQAVEVKDAEEWFTSKASQPQYTSSEYGQRTLRDEESTIFTQTSSAVSGEQTVTGGNTQSLSVEETFTSQQQRPVEGQISTENASHTHFSDTGDEHDTVPAAKSSMFGGELDQTQLLQSSSADYALDDEFPAEAEDTVSPQTEPDLWSKDYGAEDEQTELEDNSQLGDEVQHPEGVSQQDEESELQSKPLLWSQDYGTEDEQKQLEDNSQTENEVQHPQDVSEQEEASDMQTKPSLWSQCYSAEDEQKELEDNSQLADEVQHQEDAYQQDEASEMQPTLLMWSQDYSAEDEQKELEDKSQSEDEVQHTADVSQQDETSEMLSKPPLWSQDDDVGKQAKLEGNSQLADEVQHPEDICRQDEAPEMRPDTPSWRDEVSGVQYDEASEVQHDEASEVQYDEASEVQYDEASKVQYDEPSEVQYDEASKIQYDEASKVQAAMEGGEKHEEEMPADPQHQTGEDQEETATEDLHTNLFDLSEIEDQILRTDNVHEPYEGYKAATADETNLHEISEHTEREDFSQIEDQAQHLEVSSDQDEATEIQSATEEEDEHREQLSDTQYQSEGGEEETSAGDEEQWPRQPSHTQYQSDEVREETAAGDDDEQALETLAGDTTETVARNEEQFLSSEHEEKTLASSTQAKEQIHPGSSSFASDWEESGIHYSAEDEKKPLQSTPHSMMLATPAFTDSAMAGGEETAMYREDFNDADAEEEQEIIPTTESSTSFGEFDESQSAVAERRDDYMISEGESADARATGLDYGLETFSYVESSMLQKEPDQSATPESGENLPTPEEESFDIQTTSMDEEQKILGYDESSELPAEPDYQSAVDRSEGDLSIPTEESPESQLTSSEIEGQESFSVTESSVLASELEGMESVEDEGEGDLSPPAEGGGSGEEGDVAPTEEGDDQIVDTMDGQKTLGATDTSVLVGEFDDITSTMASTKEVVSTSETTLPMTQISIAEDTMNALSDTSESKIDNTALSDEDTNDDEQNQLQYSSVENEEKPLSEFSTLTAQRSSCSAMAEDAATISASVEQSEERNYMYYGAEDEQKTLPSTTEPLLMASRQPADHSFLDGSGLGVSMAVKTSAEIDKDSAEDEEETMPDIPEAELLTRHSEQSETSSAAKSPAKEGLSLHAGDSHDYQYTAMETEENSSALDAVTYEPHSDVEEKEGVSTYCDKDEKASLDGTSQTIITAESEKERVSADGSREASYDSSENEQKVKKEISETSLGVESSDWYSSGAHEDIVVALVAGLKSSQQTFFSGENKQKYLEESADTNVQTAQSFESADWQTREELSESAPPEAHQISVSETSVSSASVLRSQQGYVGSEDAQRALAEDDAQGVVVSSDWKSNEVRDVTDSQESQQTFVSSEDAQQFPEETSDFYNENEQRCLEETIEAEIQTYKSFSSSTDLQEDDNEMTKSPLQSGQTFAGSESRQQSVEDSAENVLRSSQSSSSDWTSSEVMDDSTSLHSQLTFVSSEDGQRVDGGETEVDEQTSQSKLPSELQSGEEVVSSSILSQQTFVSSEDTQRSLKETSENALRSSQSPSSDWNIRELEDSASIQARQTFVSGEEEQHALEETSKVSEQDLQSSPTLESHEETAQVFEQSLQPSALEDTEEPVQVSEQDEQTSSAPDEEVSEKQTSSSPASLKQASISTENEQRSVEGNAEVSIQTSQFSSSTSGLQAGEAVVISPVQPKLLFVSTGDARQSLDETTEGDLPSALSTPMSEWNMNTAELLDNTTLSYQLTFVTSSEDERRTFVSSEDEQRTFGSSDDEQRTPEENTEEVMHRDWSSSDLADLQYGDQTSASRQREFIDSEDGQQFVEATSEASQQNARSSSSAWESGEAPVSPVFTQSHQTYVGSEDGQRFLELKDTSKLTQQSAHTTFSEWESSEVMVRSTVLQSEQGRASSEDGQRFLGLEDTSNIIQHTAVSPSSNWESGEASVSSVLVLRSQQGYVDSEDAQRALAEDDAQGVVMSSDWKSNEVRDVTDSQESQQIMVSSEDARRALEETSELEVHNAKSSVDWQSGEMLQNSVSLQAELAFAGSEDGQRLLAETSGPALQTSSSDWHSSEVLEESLTAQQRFLVSNEAGRRSLEGNPEATLQTAQSSSHWSSTEVLESSLSKTQYTPASSEAGLRSLEGSHEAVVQTVQPVSADWQNSEVLPDSSSMWSPSAYVSSEDSHRPMEEIQGAVANRKLSLSNRQSGETLSRSSSVDSLQAYLGGEDTQRSARANSECVLKTVKTSSSGQQNSELLINVASLERQHQLHTRSSISEARQRFFADMSGPTLHAGSADAAGLVDSADVSGVQALTASTAALSYTSSEGRQQTLPGDQEDTPIYLASAPTAEGARVQTISYTSYGSVTFVSAQLPSVDGAWENLDQDSKPLIDKDAGEDLAQEDDQENLDPNNMPFDLFKKKKDKKKKKNKEAADKHATDDSVTATADATSTEQTISVAADGGDVTRWSVTEDGVKTKTGDTSDVKIDQKGDDSPAVLQTAEGGDVSMTTSEGPQIAQTEGVVDSQPTKSQGREKESLLLHEHSPEGLICCVIL